ncbi:MAG TPA: phosphate ABC transporter ATP-binding protein PstB [Candidatus Brocadiia bacterium]|nr:phosphate ABC transporter ATP-binding protein PstB [Candidatus Brocadiia bacterium]
MELKMETRQLNLFYGGFQALRDVNLQIKPREITAIIGPSGCGKSTLLRCLNRMNELIRNVRTTGQILLDGRDIHDQAMELTSLRRRVGMVFQRPNPFPLSVFDNVAYGPRVHGTTDGAKLQAIVENALRATDLWNELKDRRNSPALALSPEQQQRLCISRLVAVEPEVLLMDEPCSALDPIATARVEELMRELAHSYAIVIVTHNMQQAARVSSETVFMLLGDLVEAGRTARIFENPRDKRTEEYISGRYG